MNRRIRIVISAVIGVAILMGIVVGVGFVWLLSISGRPNVEIADHALTYEEAKSSYQLLPSSAGNIWSARSSVGMGGRAHLYRFDAPAQDCVAYANELISRSNSNSDSNHQVSTELLAISDSPDPVLPDMIQAYGFDTLDWFDVETVRNGFRGHGPPSGLSSFWIDTDRNRFYYYWTD